MDELELTRGVLVRYHDDFFRGLLPADRLLFDFVRGHWDLWFLRQLVVQGVYGYRDSAILACLPCCLISTAPGSAGSECDIEMTVIPRL